MMSKISIINLEPKETLKKTHLRKISIKNGGYFKLSGRLFATSTFSPLKLLFLKFLLKKL